jgi:hypothetical protein
MPLKCAWCQDVRDEEGTWRKPGAWDPGERAFSHGICPSCFRREAEEIRRERRS